MAAYEFPPPLAAALACGVDHAGGEGQLSDELLGQVAVHHRQLRDLADPQLLASPIPKRLTARVRSAPTSRRIPTGRAEPPMLAFPRAIPSGPDGPVSALAGKLEDGLLRHFRDRPVAIAWGMNDPAFTPLDVNFVLRCAATLVIGTGIARGIASSLRMRAALALFVAWAVACGLAGAVPR